MKGKGRAREGTDKLRTREKQLMGKNKERARERQWKGMISEWQGKDNGREG